MRDELEDVTFLDLNWDVVGRELARMSAIRRSGPIAENILRDAAATIPAPV
jgi:pyruvate ferredoxin oxidoreductase alpha subunit